MDGDQNLQCPDHIAAASPGGVCGGSECMRTHSEMKDTNTCM